MSYGCFTGCRLRKRKGASHATIMLTPGTKDFYRTRRSQLSDMTTGLYALEKEEEIKSKVTRNKVLINMT